MRGLGCPDLCANRLDKIGLPEVCPLFPALTSIPLADVARLTRRRDEVGHIAATSVFTVTALLEHWVEYNTPEACSIPPLGLHSANRSEESMGSDHEHPSEP